MGSLWESGLAHVLAGDSTIEDLLRVVDIPSGVPPGVAEVGSTIGRRPVVERAPAAGLGERVAPKVLLADSEDEPRRALRERLEADGYIVIEARDGVEALAQVDRAGPDLVLLDLDLPGLDGLTLLSRLRSHRPTAALPVMVLTANGDEDSEVRVFRLGADDFVTKPLRAGAVSARVAALLNRRWGVP
jgi:CheY-like chemotaxis protein